MATTGPIPGGKVLDLFLLALHQNLGSVPHFSGLISCLSCGKRIPSLANHLTTHHVSPASALPHALG